MDLNSEISAGVSGVPMTFKGKITNNNNYPVVDGSVYVKIFKKQSDQEKTQLNGGFLADQFFAIENISIDANGSKEASFDWRIPSYAVSGDYQIAYFFTSAKKFNLLGLTFTDDVVGNTFDFSIIGENEKIVEFDKNSVKINDKQHNFAAFIPKLPKDVEITVRRI